MLSAPHYRMQQDSCSWPLNKSDNATWRRVHRRQQSRCTCGWGTFGSKHLQVTPSTNSTHASVVMWISVLIFMMDVIQQIFALQWAGRLLISAPRLGVYYFLSLTLYVCPSVRLPVCLLVTNTASSFLFFDGIEPFLGNQFSMSKLQNWFLRFLI